MTAPGFAGSGFQKGYPIPYYCKLQEHLEPGQTVTIKGLVHQEPTMPININFKDYGGQVPLHFSFRYDEKKVVMNTFVQNKWGDETRKSIPFEKGQPFDLRIRCHQDEFEIDANGKNFHRYPYKMPLHSISNLDIDGAIVLSQVSWGGKYYTVPYEAGIAGGIKPGRVLTVTGTPDKKSKEFSISILHDSGNVGLRIRCSFNDKKIFRNSYQDGKWQNEEKEGDWPFQKDVQFDIVFVVTPYKFEIFVNGELHSGFGHRMDPKGYHGLKIEGDVEVSGISASRVD